VTVDIADELRRRYAEFGEMSDAILDFMDANRRRCSSTNLSIDSNS